MKQEARKKRMKIINGLALILFTFFSSPVQEIDSVQDQIETREFDAQKLIEYQEDPEFQYELVKPEPEGFLERLWNDIVNWFTTLFSSGTSGKVFDILWRVALIGAFVFFIIKLFGIEVTTLFKPSKSVNLPYQVSEEQLQNINFEQEIAEAIQKKQWRFVVRLTYLHALKLLADAEWLTVKKGKTNRDYLYELSGKPVEQDFEKLSFIFDYTWYGHFEADNGIAEQAQGYFSKIESAKTGGNER